MMTEVWHRFVDYQEGVGFSDDDFYSSSETRIRHIKLNVISHTAKGVWLDRGFGDRKFVLNEARKRYAYPTVELAKESFIIRKKRQISYARQTIENAEAALELIVDIK
jgi:hypothetical protein